MKLNLASGLHPTQLPDWVNIDLPWEGVATPHVYGDAMRLPFRDAAFDTAYVGHVLEHIEWDAIPAMLAELRRVLQPGATVAFVGPDIERAISTGQPEWLLRAIDTLNTGPGGHKWVADENLTVTAVRTTFPAAVAISVADIDQPEWPNPTTADWQCAVLATA